MLMVLVMVLLLGLWNEVPGWQLWWRPVLLRLLLRQEHEERLLWRRRRYLMGHHLWLRVGRRRRLEDIQPVLEVDELLLRCYEWQCRCWHRCEPVRSVLKATARSSI